MPISELRTKYGTLHKNEKVISVPKSLIEAKNVVTIIGNCGNIVSHLFGFALSKETHYLLLFVVVPSSLHVLYFFLAFSAISRFEHF